MNELAIRILRMAQSIGYLCCGFFAVVQGNHWLLLVALSLLATKALMPESNVLLFWPVGLLGVLVVTYIGYLYLWGTSSGAVSLESSRALFYCEVLFFGAISVLRTATTKRPAISFSSLRLLVVGTMSLLSIVLVVIASLRWGNDPQRMIAGFVAGGDHNAHNGVTHGLLAWSGNTSVPSPLQLYSYPNGIHFLIANLVAITSEGSRYSTLVQELRMGAWFEFVQLAAFCQLAITVFMKGAKGSGILRVLYVAPIVFVFASMDNFVGHLFWSGFTTSLGVTWLLLIPFVIPWKSYISEANTTFHIAWILWLGLLAAAAWLVYQPYAIPFLAVGLGLMAHKTLCVSFKRQTIWLKTHFELLFVASVSVITFCVSVFPYLLRGTDSPAVSSLLLSGSTYRPHFYTVALWALAALMGLQWMRRKTSLNETNTIISSASFAALLSLTICMIFIVINSSDFTVVNQPYYTVKMMWIVLFISIPIALSAIFTFWEGFIETKSQREKIGFLLIGALVIFFIPLVMGRAPKSATTNGAVNWFAKGLLSSGEKIEKSAAFSMGDRLGSHLANLALASSSKIKLPVDVALSGNPYLACSQMVHNKVEVIFTTPNGRAELIESGCSPTADYYENEIKMPIQVSNYFEIQSGIDELTSKGNLGFRLLLRGFLPPEKWGTWFGGYRSALGFQIIEDLPNPVLELKIRPYAMQNIKRSIDVGIDGETLKRIVVSTKETKTYLVPLPTNLKRRSVELTLTCEREQSEISKDDVVDGPSICAGLVSFKLINR